ncbi:MAG: hypothetical protein E3K32_09050 [wastewater metagenome]|nr:hypothetical protein [Candidatus Loosdrechtia aerotolerans]
MINIKYVDNNTVLSFPKGLVSDDYVQDFIDRLKVEDIIQKGNFEEKELMELSEKIKKKWWEKNKNRFISRIKD